jgi:hypothetical protein
MAGVRHARQEHPGCESGHREEGEPPLCEACATPRSNGAPVSGFLHTPGHYAAERSIRK